MAEDPTEIQILLSLHENLRANQDFYMNQKWKTNYFGALIYAALYFVAKEGSNFIAYFALVIAIALSFILCKLLCLHEKALHGERLADARFRCKCGEMIKKTYLKMYPKKPDAKRSKRIHLIHQTVNITAFLLTALLILHRLYPKAI